MGIKHLKLTQNKTAVVDAADYEELSKYKWFARRKKNTFYAARKEPRVNGRQKMVLLHRQILGLTDPEIKGEHRDGNGLNNRRRNLRKASHTQNMWNRRRSKSNTSGFTGVSFRKEKQKWTASISFNGKRIFLGYYATALKARRAYCKAARELHGDFARVGR